MRSGDRAKSLLLVQLAKAKLYAAKYEVLELANRAKETHGELVRCKSKSCDTLPKLVS